MKHSDSITQEEQELILEYLLKKAIDKESEFDIVQDAGYVQFDGENYVLTDKGLALGHMVVTRQNTKENVTEKLEAKPSKLEQLFKLKGD